MEIKRIWDNNQTIFHAFTNAKVNKNFNVLYEEFEDCCSSVCGCTKNPISYLMRKKLIHNDEADDPEDDYVTLDLQIIQRDMIVKAANFHYVNLENSGARAKEAHANTDNVELFDLAKTEFGKNILWVHTRLSQRIRDGHQALKLIWSNQLGVHRLDKSNTKNHKDIFALAYHVKKKSHKW